MAESVRLQAATGSAGVIRQALGGSVAHVMPDLFETILGIARWLLGTALLLLVVVLPIARSLRSMRNQGEMGIAEERERHSVVGESNSSEG